MSRFLKTAFLASCVFAASALPARADYTWYLNANFYDYELNGEWGFEPVGQSFVPFQDYNYYSSPADGGSVSGFITFTDQPNGVDTNFAASIIDYSFTTTATTQGDNPVNFFGTTYSFVNGYYLDYYNDGTPSISFISDDFLTILQITFPDLTVFSAPASTTNDGSWTFSERYDQLASTAPDGSPWNWGDARYDAQTNELGDVSYNATLNISDTPEPATLALLGSGLIALGLRRRKARA